MIVRHVRLANELIGKLKNFSLFVLVVKLVQLSHEKSNRASEFDDVVAREAKTPVSQWCER